MVSMVLQIGKVNGDLNCLVTLNNANWIIVKDFLNKIC